MQVPKAQSITMDSSWKKKLSKELELPYMQELFKFLDEEKQAGKIIYPEEQNIFKALELTPFDKTSVVIMGQDPYHGLGQAHGLSFSVQKGQKIPPSLRNIYKELHNDLKIPIAKHGNLQFWAEQGVLLLNATLTVRQSEAKSHFGKGWEKFTDAIIQKLAERKDPLIFVLWGRSAMDKCKKITNDSKINQHRILTAPHPSPFSAHTGFLGCKHFSTVNGILKKLGKPPIHWEI